MNPIIQFLEIEQIQDTTPIFMLDNSGSTASMFLNNNSILNYEIEYMKKHIIHNQIKNFYLMFWDNKFTLPFGNKLLTLESLESLNVNAGGSTHLEVGLKNLPSEWLMEREHIDIHIFTDGEINGNKDKTTDKLRELINKKCHIHITTIEANHHDYITDNCHAGNAIYTILNDNGLMKNVKKFISFNQRYNLEPFISLDNPDHVAGYVPFQGKYFKIEETQLFLKYLDKLIPSIDDNNLLKFAHELTLTLFHLTSGKALSIQRNILNLFAELFVETKIYKNVREIFLQEIDNHEKGKSTTYQAYRRNRNKIFEDAQLALYQNVKDSLTSHETNLYITFPLLDKNNKKIVISGSYKDMNKSISIGSKRYDNAGFQLGSYNLPAFPSVIMMDDGHKDQCLRQWIRTNYSIMYQLNSSSDAILYTFLTDALLVQLSENVSKEIKDGYRYLARVMLDRKRFGTNVKEYDYLLASNPPAPVKGSIDGVNYLLWKSLEHSGVAKKFVPFTEDEKAEYLKTHPNETKTNKDGKFEFIIQPFTLWYGIIKMFGDKNLNEAQLRVCQNDLTIDGVSDETIMDFLSSKLPKVDICQLPSGLKDVEYTCCITFETTSETGGYIISPHKITRNITCSPKYVISPKGYSKIESDGGNFNCPICFSSLNTNNLEQCLNQENRTLQHLKLLEEKIIVPEFNNCLTMYNTTNHTNVSIPEAYYKLDTLEQLIPLNECNFNIGSFTINSPNLTDTLNTTSIKITSQDDFNQNVWKRYPFLENLDMKNVCLAGGFCRSILLKQKLKDLDFFIYGNQDELFPTFRRFLNDVMKNIKLHIERKNKLSDDEDNDENPKDENENPKDNCKPTNKKVKFLMMYKPLYNVFEVICINDPTDFFEKEYVLDNFKQYDFKSLHRYDKNTIIDPETGKIYRKRKGYRREQEDTTAKDIENRDFSNYFEDGDITGIRMTHRLQFILAKYNAIENILDNFDMYPCRVAFDGKTTFMTPKSYFAYKYMVNVVDESKFSDLFHHRLSKYFTYGFTIVMPELNMELVSQLKNIKMGNVKFKIQGIDNQMILIKHESNIETQLKSIEALEKKNADKGKALYKSSLFCSLVSILRYVKINKVNYIFNNEIIIPEPDGKMKFRETTVDVKFIDKINSRIPTHNFYGLMRQNLTQETIDSTNKIEARIKEINGLLFSRNIKWEEKKKLEKELAILTLSKPSLECDSSLLLTTTQTYFVNKKCKKSKIFLTNHNSGSDSDSE